MDDRAEKYEAAGHRTYGYVRRYVQIAATVVAVGLAMYTMARLIVERTADAAVLLGCALVLSLINADRKGKPKTEKKHDTASSAL